MWVWFCKADEILAKLFVFLRFRSLNTDYFSLIDCPNQFEVAEQAILAMEGEGEPNPEILLLLHAAHDWSKRLDLSWSFYFDFENRPLVDFRLRWLSEPVPFKFPFRFINDLDPLSRFSDYLVAGLSL